MTHRIDFTVTGDEKSHCSGCETRIHFALQRMSGVQDVTVKAQTQRIAVTFNPARVTGEQVQERLKHIGFDVGVSP
ncbi:cation transporter [Paraburkholderia fungorum]|jgi:copper chaperone CopZ|uniref:Copper chaperone CopZ n=1 Tax=Paraburkholderia fungorum TaxID=134537 RepID=A0AAW3V4X6_9BURK|nr:heavy metal-associated domain-containing protein [Paraburkholderia fungorum]AJZ56428.1 heavy-metal-associated domain protein [Paraburkholderia fungorum]MBB4516576.1 copper chaperone CopZ [Paraburkholderia fungorum]MBB5545166.1 copper chaperone CopZ [Paraburkholderia fungorum]MBB6204951.1 copper chaperone CopZ [Paraburkholderia fungorum]MBU7440572.1 heavy-metal-associated domain-containing protein [Paraburkholderia fungorum]